MSSRYPLLEEEAYTSVREVKEEREGGVGQRADEVVKT